MPVYMARFGLAGPVKIGHSEAVARRIEQLGARLWDDLRVIRLLEGSLADEAAMHRRFAPHRIRCEWYNFTLEVMGDLGLRDIRHEGSSLPHVRTCANPIEKARASALRGWMVRHGLIEHDVAPAIGCKPGTVRDWLVYGWYPQTVHLDRLIELSRGELAPIFGQRKPPLPAEAA